MMDIYFYCSYAHSRKGFTLTRLKNRSENRFENRPENSTSAINAVRAEEVPAFVRDFFAFDGFRLLYMEFPEDDPDREMAGKSFLGVRNLRGSMQDGRKAYANIVFIAGNAEKEFMKNAVLDIVGDWKRFQAAFIRLLLPAAAEVRTGSFSKVSADYSLESDRFLQWFENCPAAASLKRKCGFFSVPAGFLRHIQSGSPGRFAGRFLYLAVCTCAFEEASKLLTPGTNRETNRRLRKKPAEVIPDSLFIAEFVERNPLWDSK